ncbi:sulfite exporter TauE/SafE family protein [Streptomyces sp. VRA16 Mangrove soil]|uniref:sulfite exporter TauE/SafE family protein n=1 Tax=Streptomyces sp. VRA16 Mangrove soil TaxID=2817434 RepID=UPI001A9E2512|nr:sulfite exporter TauE/SafE family protein [Streptomyces sp. VRA16 Mangrove soil]MBO1337429.1 sulfite exporter TauE/SafE family protein [Streptomyces sp. VRA16 Mangrove soil]
MIEDIGLALVVAVAGCVQWLTGMGFALVAAPALVLLLGPGDGVLLANCAAGVVSLAGLAGGWRRVRPRDMVPFVAAAVCTVPVGTWTAARLPEPVLMVVFGSLVCVAVTLVARGMRMPGLGGPGGALVAGGAGGFMNAAAGVGGPPFSLYAVNAGWPMREFVPNAQFYGVVVNVVSVAAGGFPRLGVRAWSVAGAALFTGAVVGAVLTGRVPDRGMRRLVLGLALVGGVVAVGKGVAGL